jgi:RHS repeat-associated protein
LGRLIKAKGGAATGISGPTANWTQDYTFDRYGNKTGTTASGITADSNSVPVDGLASVSYTTASNRISNSNWQYDLTGNLIRGQNESGVWQRFEYDAAGRLIKILDDSLNEIEEYTYGASRIRLKKETSTQRTYYAWGGNSALVEYVEPTASSTPAYSKSYIYAGSRLVSSATKASATSETWNYHHPDRLGTRLISNPDTVTSYQQSTLPFGAALDAESTGYSNRVFTSYDRSASTGLDYAVNRTYSQGQSRFTQVDPVGMSAVSVGDPQSNNLYAYVQNMPIDFRDPMGLIMETEFIYCEADRWDPSTGTLYVGRCYRYVMGGGGGPDNLPQPDQNPGGGGGGGGGGGNGPVGGAPGGANTPPGPSIKQIQDAISDCIDKIFGSEKRGLRVTAMSFAVSGLLNGSFTVEKSSAENFENSGRVTRTTSIITTDAISHGGSALADMNRQQFPKDARKYLAGYGPPGATNNNFLANDLAANPRIGMETGLDDVLWIDLAAQIHELGVSLSATYGQRNPPAKYEDRDSGMTLEDCVYNKLK